MVAQSVFNRRSFLIGASAALALHGCAYRNTPGLQFTPALFEISLPLRSNKAFLFGSIHAGQSRFYPFPELVEQAIVRSKVLAVEIDMEVQFELAKQLFRPHVFLPPQTSLESIIGKENFTAMARHFAWYGEELAKFNRHPPWFVALNMLSVDDQRAGLERSIGMESVLLTESKKNGKRIIELEKVQEQVDAFVQGSMEEQRDQLLMRFDAVRRWERTTDDLVSAWRRGDLDALNEVKGRNFGDGIKLQKLRQRLFSERDARMATRLISQLQSDSSDCFVLVGALHLAGEDSIQNALVERGAQVRRIPYG